MPRLLLALAFLLAAGGCGGPVAATAGTPAVAPTGALVTSTASAFPSSPDDGRAAVLAAVSTFEDKRASGDAQVAFDLLAPRWQSVFGSVERFRSLMAAYVGEGGRQYTIAGATRDPDRLAPGVVGDAWPDVEASAAAGRAWIVDVRHPGIRGASAGSEVLLVAPDPTGALRIWILH